VDRLLTGTNNRWSSSLRHQRYEYQYENMSGTYIVDLFAGNCLYRSMEQDRFSIHQAPTSSLTSIGDWALRLFTSKG
jgi:hypothetical protein